jgi:hypothetical protein
MFIYIAQWETMFKMHELCSILLYVFPS